MKNAWIVFRKELMDALRDRRTLLVVLLSSVAMGPLVLVLLSTLVADAERRAEAREVLVHGLEHAPSLRNHLERQTYTVKAAPAGYEALLADSKLAEPVVVVLPGFEADLAAARAPLVEVVGSSANRRAQVAVGRVMALLRGFNQEQATLRLALRGVSPSLLEAVQVEERDLADPGARALQLTAMVPFFVLMAVLYGALNAALDSTAGEHERGSLEPLLMNPASRAALALGKWAAVAAVGMLIAVLSCLSFLPGQWLLRSESLAAMFRFGPREAALFVALLLPLAGALSGVLMAIAIRSRSVKEAQASSSVVVLLTSLVPLVSIFGQGGEAAWHLWVPALGQVTLMTRVLKGEVPGLLDLAVPLAVSVVVAAASVADVARRLRRSALAQ
ncbi:MAG: ABC transporter permease [Rubrivivax sp.]|nr:ABC transporter permease [Rubrivivax sp.]